MNRTTKPRKELYAGQGHRSSHQVRTAALHLNQFHHTVVEQLIAVVIVGVVVRGRLPHYQPIEGDPFIKYYLNI